MAPAGGIYPGYKLSPSPNGIQVEASPWRVQTYFFFGSTLR
jgi:hypothetical protein